MKIVILCSYYHPEVVGTAAHVTSLARELRDRGHDVSVFCPMPHYPEWRIDGNYRGRLFLDEEIDGIRVFRSWLRLPARGHIGFKARALAELSAVKFQSLHILRHLRHVWQADKVLVVSPFFSQGFLALALRLFLRRPYIFHVDDIVPDSALDTGVLDSSGLIAKRFISLAFAVEKLFYRKAECVSTLTEGMRQNIRQKVPDARIIHSGLWVDIDRFRPSEQHRDRFRAQYGYQDDDLVIGYAGNIGRKQNLGALVDLAGRLRERDPRFHVVIVGDGAGRPEIAARIEERGLTNVRLLPLLDDEGYLGFLNGVDLSYVSQTDRAADLFIPSKIYTTFAAGCPVICFANPATELYRVMKESDGAFSYDWSETDLCAEEMVALLNKRDVLREKSESALRYALDHFTKAQALAEFFDAMESRT